VKKPKTEIVIRTYEQFENYVLKWANHDWENDPRTLISKRFVRRRTRSQENTVRMIIRRCAEEVGDDPDTLFDQFKEAFGPHEDVPANWDSELIIHQPKSSSEWDIEENAAMIEKALYVAATHYQLIIEIEDK